MTLNLAALAQLAQRGDPNATPATATPTNPTQPETTVQNATSESANLSVSLAKLAAAQAGSATSDSQGSSKAVSGNEAFGVSEAKVIKYQEISDRIFQLKEAIHTAHPKMPGLLQEIWSTIKSYPEQVTLLEEDQMEIIISGLEKVVDTDLAQITLKSATTGSKKSKTPVSMDSLGF